MIKAEIVAHSRNQQGDELISVLATFPRIILSEMNTHRMLSKNTSSSRAIPLNKMIEAVQKNPFIPIAWQKKHSGMQGSEYFDNHFSITGNYNLDTNYGFWMDARDEAVRYAECLGSEGLTKQLANRLLEPFMWTTMLITGPKSGWNSFFNLRCPIYDASLHSTFVHNDNLNRLYKSRKDMVKHFGNINRTEIEWLSINKGQAEIHIMDLAEKIYDAMNESTPKQLKAGEWHIPFGNKMTDDDLDENLHISKNLREKMSITNDEEQNKYWDRQDLLLNEARVKVSTAMAARTSYTVVGEEKEVDYEALIGLHDRLIAQDPPHSSPLEHCARAMSDEEHGSYIKGKIDLIDVDEPEYNGGIYEPRFSEKGWCNNFKGFIPYRYLVDNSISL